MPRPNKIAEFGVGLLSGMEYLPDLSKGPAPLARDYKVSHAATVPSVPAYAVNVESGS